MNEMILAAFLSGLAVGMTVMLIANWLLLKPLDRQIGYHAGRADKTRENLPEGYRGDTPDWHDERWFPEEYRDD